VSYIRRRPQTLGAIPLDTSGSAGSSSAGPLSGISGGVVSGAGWALGGFVAASLITMLSAGITRRTRRVKRRTKAAVQSTGAFFGQDTGTSGILTVLLVGVIAGGAIYLAQQKGQATGA